MFLFDNQVASLNLTFKYFTHDDNLLGSSESSTVSLIQETTQVLSVLKLSLPFSLYHILSF
jgi:hypothetical protein